MYAIGEVVQLEDLLQQFIAKVANAAITGTLNCSENPTNTPVDNYIDSKAGLQMYPTTGLGKHRFGEERQPIMIGTPSDKTGYGSVYAALTHLTKMLLKIGGWSYRNARTGSYDNTTSGKAIFNNATLFQAFSVSAVDNINLTLPTRASIAPRQPITFTSFETMFADCLNAWSASKKPHVRLVNITCHSNCHSNHSNTCHTNGTDPAYCNEWMNPYKSYTPGQSYGCNECNCYVNGDNVYGLAKDSHQDVAGGGHTNNNSSKDSCHTNTVEIYLA